MNDDLRDFRHKDLEYDYIRDEVKEMGKIYTAREVSDRDYEAIIRLLKENDWKLEVSTLNDGHYIGNSIRSMGPFTTKSMVKTVKRIWKEKKKMNSVFGMIVNLIMPKKDLTRGVIGYGYTDELIVDRGFKNKKQYVIYKKGEK